MGMLILTKSTRRLIRRFNREFNSSNISNYVNNNNNKQWFASPQTANPWYLLDVCDHFNIYPTAHPQHPKLKERWQYFLRWELWPTWHQEIRTAIYTALDGSYTRIIFDTLESNTQQVIWGTEFESADNEDTTDTKKYMKIVLVTPRTNAPPNPAPALLPPKKKRKPRGKSKSKKGR